MNRFTNNEIDAFTTVIACIALAAFYAAIQLVLIMLGGVSSFQFPIPGCLIVTIGIPLGVAVVFSARALIREGYRSLRTATSKWRGTGKSGPDGGPYRGAA